MLLLQMLVNVPAVQSVKHPGLLPTMMLCAAPSTRLAHPQQPLAPALPQALAAPCLAVYPGRSCSCHSLSFWAATSPPLHYRQRLAPAAHHLEAQLARLQLVARLLLQVAGSLSPTAAR